MQFFEVYPKPKPSWRNEMEVADAISLLNSEGFKVVPNHVEDLWKDTGKPEITLEANHPILDGIEAMNEGEVGDGAIVVGVGDTGFEIEVLFLQCVDCGSDQQLASTSPR